MLRENKKMERNPKCPMPSPRITFACTIEEAGSGTPIIFLHEFAADHTNWEPQMRYFSRGHRCIAYSARGYTPSDVPPTPRSTPTSISIPTRSPCSIISASPKRISSACRWAPILAAVGLNAPERALSMTLAAVGSGSSIENLDAFRAQCRAKAEQYESIGSVEVRKPRARRQAGFRSC
jgi:proline iminopeptidase